MPVAEPEVPVLVMGGSLVGHHRTIVDTTLVSRGSAVDE
jgi:hypothetical protein